MTRTMTEKVAAWGLIKRLSESRSSLALELFERGRSSGEEWALERASYEDLLEVVADGLGSIDWVSVAAGESALNLCRVVLSGRRNTVDSKLAFDFAYGFVAGARAVWDAVEHDVLGRAKGVGSP